MQVWARSTPSLLAGLLPIAVWALFMAGELGAGATLVAVSTLGSANDLTVTNTASSPYSLKVMTVAAAILFPVVLAYQGWTYHVFRHRVGAAESSNRDDVGRLPGS